MNNKDGQKGQGFFSTFRSPETSRRVPFIDQFETIKCISPEPTIKMKSIIQAFRIKDWGASIDLKDISNCANKRRGEVSKVLHRQQP